MVTETLEPGQIASLGWSYEEERQYLIQASQTFNLREALTAWWAVASETHARPVEPDECLWDAGLEPIECRLTLEKGYPLFIAWLEAQGLAKELTLALEVRPQWSTSSTSVHKLFYVTDGSDRAWCPLEPLAWKSIAQEPPTS